MIIDIHNTEIILTEIPDDLDPRVKLQLKSVWNFEESPDGRSLSREFEGHSDLIRRLPEYLAKQGFVISLGGEYESLRRGLDERRKAFATIVQDARDYKNGALDDGKLVAFRDYLRTLPRELKDHQIKAALHLFVARNGANFSVPGSGKTSVILSVYEKLRREEAVNILFVVGPTACFFPWQTEFELTLGRAPETVVLAGRSKSERTRYYYLAGSHRPELYLTSFQTLTNDVSDLLVMFRNKESRIFFVIDEAHYIKKLEGTWASSVLRISRYPIYRCVLTGTPLPHSYDDLYNIFDCLWPDEKPIDDDTRIKIQLLNTENTGNEAKELINEKIGPLFYRVRKSELGLGPQIFHEPNLITMNPVERKLYESILQRIRYLSADDYVKEQDVLEKLIRGRMMRLRQTASYAKLLETAFEGEQLIDSGSELHDMIINYDALERPAKLDELLKVLTEFRSNRLKVVVWTHFIGTLKLILENLKTVGLQGKGIWGDVPIEKDDYRDAETREMIREEFVDPNSGLDILVANPAACAESISLHTTCWNSVYYDLSFNGAQYLQSLDRIHRVGGSEDKEIHYYFLQYENSIDQAIMMNLENKRARMNDLIERDYAIYSLDMFEDDEVEHIAYNSILDQD